MNLYEILKPLLPSLKWLYTHPDALTPMTPPAIPPETPKMPPSANATVNPDTLYAWDSSIENNKHNVRALCDLAELDWKGKQTITACVEIESNFQSYYLAGVKKGQPVINKNLRPDGSLSSEDIGIVQVNTKYHIGPGLDFPSVEYVLGNPTADVDWMIAMYKQGRIGMWDSYTNMRDRVNQYYRDMAAKYGLTF